MKITKPYIEELIKLLGFTPKDGVMGVYCKHYSNANNYTIEVDVANKSFNYGELITADNKSTQNFSQAENWVVFECVDRLLAKGYQPQNITLEKTRASGRLDIFVTDNDNKPFLMIECKTAGTEYTKEHKKTLKDGGQLFTYYHFLSKALTPESLVEITQEDSGKIFNRFLEILRHHVVSDKANAFNKIFTLFLCKIFDEKSTPPGEELKFQWLEGVDDDISFQKRLTDLYGKGMSEFLSKKVTDFSDSDFDDEFGHDIDETLRKKLLEKFTRIRLMKNNEFAIKEVFDRDSFDDNGKVVKELVELLQDFKIRYTKKQQYLSDFFELLITTGLKQESGQFFTPVPIAQFIIRSLPIDKIINEKLEKGEADNLLPAVIDYAAGSGHFLTESMHVMQDIINSKNNNDYIDSTAKKIRTWQDAHFDWADQYVYGIEKDYRLVKVGKVGCYLHGDGIANVVHSDGLGNFTSTQEYTSKLKHSDDFNAQDNRQFDIVISNPPYSVSAFKNNARKYYNEKDFELYDEFTDQSSEIECLFIERTKQLLKDGGVAGIILPSSILNNGGVYTKARELILRYFEVIAITELGSNTFMATGTNTVTLFLRRRKNHFAVDIENNVNTFANNLQDITIKGIDTPVAKYVTQAWENLTLDDYLTIFQKVPNSTVKSHEIYEEYVKKIKEKNNDKLIAEIIDREKEKLLYFIIAYSQKLVLVKSGEKKAEKAFLGYEFSNRRGSEGIHPIQRGKSIDECTKLYDAEQFQNKEKASTYIYDAFNDDLSREIDNSLKDNVRRIDLVDTMTFDRVDFDKSISLSTKKNIKIESQWEQVKLEDLSLLIKRGKSAKYGHSSTQIIKSGQARGLQEFDFKEKYFVADTFVLDERKLEKGDLLINSSGVGTAGRVTLFDLDGTFVADSHITIVRLDKKKILPRYALSCFASIGFKTLGSLALGQSGQIEMTIDTIANIKLPIPPKNIQEKIVSEFSRLEVQQRKGIETVKELKVQLKKIVQSFEDYEKVSLGDYAKNLDRLRRPVTRGNRTQGEIPYYGASGIVDYVNDYLIDDDVLLIAEDGANLKSRNAPIAITVSGKIWVNNHAHVLKFANLETRKIVDHYLNNADISAFITGQAQPKLNQQNLSRIKVPKVPALEQKKIVTKIEVIESNVIKMKEDINSISQQKEVVLKKYL